MDDENANGNDVDFENLDESNLSTSSTQLNTLQNVKRSVKSSRNVADAVKNTDNMIMETLKSIGNETNKEENTQDGDVLYFQSLVGRFKELPKRKKS